MTAAFSPLETVDLDVEPFEQGLHRVPVDRRGGLHVQHDAVAGIGVERPGELGQGLTDPGGGARSRDGSYRTQTHWITMRRAQYNSRRLLPLVLSMPRA